MKQSLITLALVSLLASAANAGLLFNYSQLATKDLDQMAKIVQNKIKESNKYGGDRTIPLKEALQAVYSRPNEDALIEKIQPQIKSALDENNAWEKSIRQLTKEAIGALKNPKAFSPVVQVTYLVFLENIISEFKPKNQNDFEKSILTQIKDAKITLSKEATQERLLRVMKESKSPSELAEIALGYAVPSP
jgi:hypothetical protein